MGLKGGTVRIGLQSALVSAARLHEVMMTRLPAASDVISSSFPASPSLMSSSTISTVRLVNLSFRVCLPVVVRHYVLLRCFSQGLEHGPF